MQKYDKRAIMRRAHSLKQSGVDFSSALKQAWAEAKTSNVPAVPPHRLPLEAIVMDTYALIKKASRARRICAGLRIKIDIGIAIDERRHTKTLSGSVIYSNDRNALTEITH